MARIAPVLSSPRLLARRRRVSRSLHPSQSSSRCALSHRREWCRLRDEPVRMKSLEAAKIMKIEWLVLGCIEAEICKKIFVGKLLTRSTRFTCFCTAQTSIFQQIFVTNFWIFSQFFKQHRQNCSMFVPIRAETSPIFVGISQIFQKFLPQSTYRKSEENPRIFEFCVLK